MADPKSKRQEIKDELDKRFNSLSDEKVALPKDDDGNVNPGSVGWYAVSDGEGGITWDDSAPGSGGGSGEDGGYYAPSVDDNGNLTWTASKSDMPAVDGANIKGPTGDTGATGEAGPAGADGKDGADGADGADGKSAYEYAVEGGYTGTEEEFAAKLAAEKFANPNALTFTGAATGSYDGSEAVTVEIPSGGGGGSGYTYNATYTVEEDVDSYFAAFPTRDCKKILLNISCATTPSTAPTFMIVIDSHKPAGAISLTTTTFLWAEISVFFDVTRYYYTSTHGAANNVSARTHYSAFLKYAYASDDGFVITSLPAGTVIEIWGVKK